MSEPINVLLPELVVRPRGSYITYTGKETNRPSVADFIKSKAQEARVNMSLTSYRGIVLCRPSGNGDTYSFKIKKKGMPLLFPESIIYTI